MTVEEGVDVSVANGCIRGVDECGVRVLGVVLGKVYPLSPPKRLGLILPVGLHPEGPGDSASKARVVDPRNSRRLQWGTVARRRAPPWSWPYVQLANEGSPTPPIPGRLRARRAGYRAESGVDAKVGEAFSDGARAPELSP